MVWSKFLDKRWDIGKVCNGVLAGLVSITAPCAYVETWAAVIIGTNDSLDKLSPIYLTFILRYCWWHDFLLERSRLGPLPY